MCKYCEQGYTIEEDGKNCTVNLEIRMWQGKPTMFAELKGHSILEPQARFGIYINYCPLCGRDMIGSNCEQ